MSIYGVFDVGYLTDEFMDWIDKQKLKKTNWKDKRALLL